jgi:hypothetical protein
MRSRLISSLRGTTEPTKNGITAEPAAGLAPRRSAPAQIERRLFALPNLPLDPARLGVVIEVDYSEAQALPIPSGLLFMLKRAIVVVLALTCMTPALASDLSPVEARRVLVGRLWSFDCSEGTKGFGSIFANGSVRGTMQESGARPISHNMPAGTVSMQSDSFCASVPVGPVTIRPCFTFSRIDSNKFRGRVSSPAWMWLLWGQRYCDLVGRDL